MPEQRLFPQWRAQHASTAYPFTNQAGLTSDDGRVLLEGTFLDASLTIVGAQAGLYLSKVEITHQEVTLHVGDPVTPDLASGTFDLVSPSDDVVLTDLFGRPAGILVSESLRLAVFQSWGVGTHTFKQAQTEFCASICFPVPTAGVRGILLEDGTVLSGDVWLIGADGVVLRADTVNVPPSCGVSAQSLRAVRIDVVGDPLFRRRLCFPADLFSTPNFVRRLRVLGPNSESFDVLPDALGNVLLVGNNDLADDTVLRVTTDGNQVILSAVGQQT